MSGMKGTMLNSLDRVFEAIPFDNGLDFGYCCVAKEQVLSFTLTNHATTGGSIRFNFETADNNFVVTPTQGAIAPRQKKEISIAFNSTEAKVIIGTMICRLAKGDEEKTRVLKMSAMSKYPFITLNQDKIDFESLLVGKVEQ